MKFALGTIVSLVIVILFALFASVVTINSGEVGILSKFGVVQPAPLQPGIHLVLPGATSINRLSTQLIAEPEEFTSLTSDSQRVTITATPAFSIDPIGAPAAYANVGRTVTAIVSRTVQPVLLAAVKQVVSQYDINYIIEHQQEVTANISQVVTENLKSKPFIRFERIDVTGFVLDPQVQDAIEKKQIAKQELERKQTELQTAAVEAQRLAVIDKALTTNILMKEAIDKWNGESLIPPTAQQFPGLISTGK